MPVNPPLSSLSFRDYECWGQRDSGVCPTGAVMDPSDLGMLTFASVPLLSRSLRVLKGWFVSMCGSPWAADSGLFCGLFGETHAFSPPRNQLCQEKT